MELYRIDFSRSVSLSLLRRVASEAGFELLGKKELGTTFQAEIRDITDVPSSPSEVWQIFDSELKGLVINVTRIRRPSVKQLKEV